MAKKKIKITKKSANKPSQKPLKKIIKKETKKPVKKPAKKADKKPVKKIAPKKIKKEKKPAKPIKKLEIKKAKKPEKNEKKTGKEKKISLAKTILAKGKEKKVKEKKETHAKPEKKHEVQKIIFLRKVESNSKVTFKVGDHAVYPSHGIGKIVDIESTPIMGKDFKCYLMYFEKEKLTIKIPVSSADKIGLRHLISKSQMDEVFTILRSGIKKLKGMWSRRAQEYETKINSGDIMLLAEVLRDLTRDIEDSERSYSERIIYETAINRLASEYSAIYGIDFEEAKQKVILTAKDKLNSEGKIVQKDEFDDFDSEDSEREEDEDEENEDEEDEDEEDEDDDFDYDDDEDDEKPRKKKKK